MAYPSPAVRAAVSRIAVACRENRDPEEIAELRDALAVAKLEQQIADNLARLSPSARARLCLQLAGQ